MTSLKVMEVILARKTSLSKLASALKIYPQVLLNIRVKDKEAAQNDADVLAAVKRVEDKLGNRGRILVRASGTEPLVRIMVEAESEKQCKTFTKEIAEVLRNNGHTVK